MEYINNKNIEEIKKKEREKRDEEAIVYVDFIEKVYGLFRCKAYTESILHYLKLSKSEVWLDAGSGVGRMSFEIAPSVKRLVCIDHSLVSLTVLGNNAESRELTNIQIIHSDMCDFTGETDYFHGILCNEVLQHIPSYEERLRGTVNLFRMLRRGGRCLVNVIRWQCSSIEEKEGYWGKNQEIYRNYFTQGELMRLMKEAGFNKVYLRGLDILPRRISDVLPIKWASLDAWCSRIPASVHWGNNILAIGIK